MHTSATTVRFLGNTSFFSNEFPSLVCCFTVIYHSRPQKPTLFRGILHMCSVMCTQGNCSRINAGSGNRTSAPMQALHHCMFCFVLFGSASVSSSAKPYFSQTPPPLPNLIEKKEIERKKKIKFTLFFNPSTFQRCLKLSIC